MNDLVSMNFVELPQKNDGKFKKGHKHTDGWKKEMSERMKGKNNPFYGKTHTKEIRLKIGIVNKGNTHAKGIIKSDETKQKIREKRKLQIITEEDRKKNSDALRGRKLSDNHIEKLRIAKLNWLKNQGIKFTYNLKACQFIEEFGKKNGYNFQHALNGGEVEIFGFRPDGFDKEKNVVFEYDESGHEWPSKKLRDLRRTERLINKIGCKIIRFSEKYNRTYISTPTYSEILI